MYAFWLTAALLCAVGGASNADHTIQGACQGLDDDCEVAYTSLLQESASLFKQETAGHEKQETAGHEKARDQPRLTQGAAAQLQKKQVVSSFKNTLLMVLAVLVPIAILGGVVAYFLILPAMGTAHHRRLSGGHRASTLEALLINYDNQDAVDTRSEDSLDQDAYCLAIALIARDLQALAVGNCNKALRTSRLAFSIGLILMTVSLQISIVVCTKKFVTPQQVDSIRGAYSDFEQAMYGEHTYVNEHGKHRGIEGFFNASAFDGLSDDMKGSVCNIPLSQLGFISLVILVWAITCMAQLKKCVENFLAVICFAHNVHSMSDCLSASAEEDDEDCNDDDDNMEDGINDGLPRYTITGLTLPVKVLMSLFIFLPDMATTSYLLWLGSRWLIATNDFGNIVSNAVALEFILMLKVLLYFALTSERNKRDLEHTALAPCWSEEPAGYGIYFSGTIWFVLAVLWVYFYVTHWQAVLPDYKWDVHSVCTPWLQSMLDPDAGN